MVDYDNLKVGDKVTLITLEEAFDMYGAEKYNGELPNIPFACVESMLKSFGTEVEVEGLINNGFRHHNISWHESLIQKDLILDLSDIY